MPWFKSQFDKLLMASIFLLMCALALAAPNNDKLSTFALQSAAALLGGLMLLVTGRRPLGPEPPEPTSSTTKIVTTSEVRAETAPPAKTP